MAPILVTLTSEAKAYCNLVSAVWAVWPLTVVGTADAA